MKENVLITGASRGLGVFLKEKFSAEGHFVLSHNGRAHFDISNTKQVEDLAQLAIKNDIISPYCP